MISPFNAPLIDCRPRPGLASGTVIARGRLKQACVFTSACPARLRRMGCFGITMSKEKEIEMNIHITGRHMETGAALQAHGSSMRR